MTLQASLRQPPSEKLCFLAETVLAEAALRQITDGRLFAATMDAQRAATLREDVDLAERVDAFVARFGRLQNTVGDKLLPAVLAWLAEPIGPAIDNLAEPSGWAGWVWRRTGSNAGNCVISRFTNTRATWRCWLRPSARATSRYPCWQHQPGRWPVWSSQRFPGMRTRPEMGIDAQDRSAKWQSDPARRSDQAGAIVSTCRWRLTRLGACVKPA